MIRILFFDTNPHQLPQIHAKYQGQVAVAALEAGSLKISL
jgi:hypothetical protein